MVQPSSCVTVAEIPIFGPGLNDPVIARTSIDRQRGHAWFCSGAAQQVNACGLVI
jgi:hypothetical protein